MYLEHFGFTKYPFKAAPDPGFYYPTARHREALACLVYAVEQRKGFALITGEVGTGKTMLCRAALSCFGPGVDVAMVSHTLLTAKQFLQAVCTEFDLEAEAKTKFELLRMLKAFLLKKTRQGRTAVLIVDEAQDLSVKVLEEVRLLGNLETSNEKLLDIILVGQPELRAIIARQELRQLEQRIALKFHLGPLSRSDMSGYIDHRLQAAGGDNSRMFDAEAKFRVFKASNGVPRLVNIICDQALLQAYVNDEHTVKAPIVERVIADREGYYMDEAPEEWGGDVPRSPLQERPTEGSGSEFRESRAFPAESGSATSDSTIGASRPSWERWRGQSS